MQAEMKADTTPSVQESSSVQDTLRRVIELGYYGPDVYDEARGEYSRQRYMCCALAQAAALGEITGDELDRATAEIDAYLGHVSVSMASHLRRAGLWCGDDYDVFAETVGRQLYWDWDKRPSLD